MEQGEIESRVQKIFEEQGFRVSKQGNRLNAENGKNLSIAVFSSERYSTEDVEADVRPGDLVFVDEELDEVQGSIENDVSIIKSDDREQYELPSYELIGDIAVINELVGIAREEAVKGIKAHHPRVKTVLLKADALEGEFRVGEYEKLYGDETETLHREFGCRFKVDPARVYFSERFSTERNRVVSQVQNGEELLVMFAGVGPFAVMAARNRNPARVMAVEKNPVAVEYMIQNIELNGVADTVEAVEADVKEAVPELGMFDRIVMPLPGQAEEYLGLAFEHVKHGGTIHYYRFAETGEWGEVLKEVEKAADEAGKDFEVLKKVVCGHRGPGTDRVCLDILVE